MSKKKKVAGSVGEIEITVLRDVVRHYLGVLQESSQARRVVEGWGVNVRTEVIRVGKVQERVLELLADGWEGI